MQIVCLSRDAWLVARSSLAHMNRAPLVSVIVATYNRSHLVALAIDSVRRSTLEDWELIVVGDHCTDDTGEVVASIGDARISYVNLPRNAGEQSAANSEGMRRARGRYLAFLNHDDFYFPDHLGSAVAWCQRWQADFVWSPLIVALPVSEEQLVARDWRFRLSGVPLGDDYDPRIFVFASAWLLTRELAERVGRWRPARETFVTSSQDWLFRAWRSSARMRFNPHPSVLAVPLGPRAGGYVAARNVDHEVYAAELRNNPHFRDRALAIAAVAGERESNRYRLGDAIPEALRALIARPAAAAAISLGMHPYTPYFALRHGRRGNLIDHSRRRGGLGKLSQ